VGSAIMIIFCLITHLTVGVNDQLNSNCVNFLRHHAIDIFFCVESSPHHAIDLYFGVESSTFGQSELMNVFPIVQRYDS